MSTLSIFQEATAIHQTGYEVEQHLFNLGYQRLGQRTYASAWSTPSSDKVIRISSDAFGSEEFFTMAQKREDNPYFPVVYGHMTLPSGDHIACVEKLISNATDTAINRYRKIFEAVKNNETVDPIELMWKEDVDRQFEKAKIISMTFLKAAYKPDIEALPHPEAFQDASVAVLELGEEAHTKDSRFFPGGDINVSNILFRNTAKGLQPVFNDTLKRPYGSDEIPAVQAAREKFGLPPLSASFK